jgi:hypothetical protein
MKPSVPGRSLRTLPLILLALASAGALSGCIRSRVTISSEPAGAEVIWRGQPYGATPVTIPIIWYWYYDFALEKPGYQRLEVTERFRTPPWFLMPLDLVMELVPIPISDTRERNYPLTPATSSALPVRPTETVLTPETIKSLQKPQ